MRLPLQTSLLLFFIVFTGGIAAQPRIGLKLGVGFSMPIATYKPNTYGTTTRDGSATGFVWGAFVQVPLNRQLSLQPSLQFSNKGIREKHTAASNGYTSTYTVSSTYLEVPLNIIHSFKEKHNGFLIGAGPVISFLRNGRGGRYPLKSTDIGASFLMGYQLPIGFSMNLSYTHGFTNVSADGYSLSELKNRYASFYIGYLF